LLAIRRARASSGSIAFGLDASPIASAGLSADAAASVPLVAEIGRSGRLFVAALDRLTRRRPSRAAMLDDTDRLGELIYRSGAHILQHGMLTKPVARILSLTARDCGSPLLAAIVGAQCAATVPGCPRGSAAEPARPGGQARGLTRACRQPSAGG